MSVEATQWAFSQDIKPSSVKFVLVALGDNAQGDGLAWPSIAALAQKTGQDRKTVMAALDKLEAMGYLADTGKRMGATGQVKVYRFNFGRSNGTENPANSTESGTLKDSQTVPDFPNNSTVFPLNSTVFPPKSTETGTRNHQEPSRTINEPKKDIAAKPAKKSKPTLIPLPADFAISERVRRWAAEKGHTRLEDHFENFVGAAKAKGYAYADWDEAFMGAIRGDWAKLKGQPPRQPGGKVPAKENFDEKNYGTSGRL